MLHFLRRLVLTAGQDPARDAVAGFGGRFHRGPVDNVSFCGIRFSFRRAGSGSALEGIMAGPARRGAGCWAVALGSQAPPDPGRAT
jgi:hypothetical protein